MSNIAVKYIDTQKYKVKIHYDEFMSSWEDFTDLSTIIQFRDRDFTSYADLDDYLTENGKLTPAVQSKLRAGKMFTIDYARYSNTDGGFYRLDGAIPSGEVDSRDVNGFVILEDVDGMSYDQRRALAEATLKEYTDWANGNVYGVVIEDQSGNEIDSCWGFIGDEAVKSYINEMLPDALPENVEIVGVYPDGSEYETYITLGGK